MSEGLSFKQAVIVAAIPSLIGIAATYYSKKIESNQVVIQARMSERDLISREAIIINENKSESEKFVNAYMIPVSNNLAWEKYYACRINNKETRFMCANNQRNVNAELTPEIVRKKVNFGF